MTEEKRYREIQRKLRVTSRENDLIKERMALHGFKNFNTYARYMLLVVAVDVVNNAHAVARTFAM